MTLTEMINALELRAAASAGLSYDAAERGELEAARLELQRDALLEAADALRRAIAAGARE